MRLLKTKFYLHKLGDGPVGERPRLIIARQFENAYLALRFQKAHPAECSGYVVDSGRYIMEQASGVQIAQFVEVQP